MIKINKDGSMVREAVPAAIANWDITSLQDMSKTDSSLGLRGTAWWPEEDHSQPLLEGQVYGPEVLTADTARKVVITSRTVLEPDPVVFDQIKAKYMSQIDNLVENRIKNSTRFSLAYQQREAAALAFKAAGYTGNPTDWIARFAGNAGLSLKDACDLILRQANGLRNALMLLDNFRMDKYSVKSATTIADMLSRYVQVVESINAVIIP